MGEIVNLNRVRKDRAKAEARATAEQRMQKLADEVYRQTGAIPAVHIREGAPAEQLVQLIQEDTSVSLLVLATAANAGSPGPVVSYLLSNLGRKVRIPITLVPGELTTDEIDAFS